MKNIITMQFYKLVICIAIISPFVAYSQSPVSGNNGVYMKTTDKGVVYYNDGKSLYTQPVGAWYVSFGDSYRDVVAKITPYVKSIDNNPPPNELQAYTAYFAGYTWNFANLSFVSNKLYHIGFTMSVSQDTDLSGTYEAIITAMKKKYLYSKNADGVFLYSTEVNVFKEKDWTIFQIYNKEDKCVVSCHITRATEVSKGGEKRNYLDVNYYDVALRALASKADESEL